MPAPDFQGKVTSFLYPILIGISSYLIISKVNNVKSDLSELKTDVKQLSQNRAEDKVDIEMMKDEVNRLSDKVYTKPILPDYKYPTIPPK